MNLEGPQYSSSIAASSVGIWNLTFKFIPEPCWLTVCSICVDKAIRGSGATAGVLGKGGESEEGDRSGTLLLDVEKEDYGRLFGLIGPYGVLNSTSSI